MTATETDKPKIYCFINSGSGTEWVMSLAVAEDGTCLTSHCSSSDMFAKGDSGFDPRIGLGQAKQNDFAEHYPDGFETVWLDDPRPGNDAGFDAAIEKNRLQGEAEKKRKAEAGEEEAVPDEVS